MVHTSGQAETHRFEGALEAQAHAAQSSSSCGGHGLLTLVVVPHVAAKLRSEVEGDARAHVSEELVSPNPSAIGNEFPRERIHGIVVRAFRRKVPRFKALEPQVEREGGVWEALGPANLDVVRQPAISHDS